jgi:hypothetical protein
MRQRAYRGAMVRVRLVRFLVLAVGLLAVTAAGAQDQTSMPGADVHPVGTTYPTNAAKIFRWGNAQVKDEFKAPLASRWAVNRKSQVRNQHGMLTLDATAAAGDVVATLTGNPRQYGRWEARVRGRQYGTGGTPYRVVWELAPYGAYNCGARSIVLADYALGSNLATMHLRNLPDVDHTASKALPLSGNQFHTYAVEVTPDHISWFVDTRVVMTERRASARTGERYAMRFRLVGTPGARMNRGRMQMDWARYYTLERRNAQSIEAPQASLGRYADAC